MPRTSRWSRRTLWGRLCVGAFLVALWAPSPVAAEFLQATYLFDGTLNPLEPGAPALRAVNLLGRNRFETALVYGQMRTVYRWDGNAQPLTQQAGLVLPTAGLIPANNYSIEMVFQFFDRADAYRRILDPFNRTSDYGFYVDPSNRLNVYPEGAGITEFTNNAFHHVVLTNSSSGGVSGYLDGRLEFTLNTNVMNINNPESLLNFFLDDEVAVGEYSNGQVALIRVYDGILNANTVADLARDPFGPAVPEPASVVLLSVGALGLLGYGWRGARWTRPLAKVG